MTDKKLIITKATEEQVKTIDEASRIENRSRSNFVKTYAYLKAKEILEGKDGN